MHDGDKPNILLRVLRLIPPIGTIMRLMAEERVGALAAIVGVFVAAAAGAIFVWGYPALITIYLALTALVGLLVLSTAIR